MQRNRQHSGGDSSNPKMLPSSCNIIGESSYFQIKVESGLETSPTANVNGDAVVNIQDLVIVVNAF